VQARVINIFGIMSNMRY